MLGENTAGTTHLDRAVRKARQVLDRAVEPANPLKAFSGVGMERLPGVGMELGTGPGSNQPIYTQSSWPGPKSFTVQSHSSSHTGREQAQSTGWPSTRRPPRQSNVADSGPAALCGSLKMDPVPPHHPWPPPSFSCDTLLF